MLVYVSTNANRNTSAGRDAPPRTTSPARIPSTSVAIGPASDDQDRVTGGLAEIAGVDRRRLRVGGGDHVHPHGPQDRQQRGHQAGAERLEPRLRVEGESAPQARGGVVQARGGPGASELADGHADREGDQHVDGLAHADRGEVPHRQDPCPHVRFPCPFTRTIRAPTVARPPVPRRTSAPPGSRRWRGRPRPGPAAWISPIDAP